MAFIAEDGTGLANANSLCPIAYATAYFAERKVAAWEAADVEDQRAALIKATDYVEARWGAAFLGTPQFPDTPQALSFPRLYINKDDMVPAGIKRAVAEYALRALTDALAPDVLTDSTGLVVTGTTKKVGPIETSVTYQPGAARTLREYPAADMLVRPFVRGSGGRVYR